MLSLPNQEVLRKAILDTVAGSALIPESLSQLVTDRAREITTFFPFLTTMPAGSNTYQWNDITVYPNVYAMGQKAAPTAKSSTYNRRTVDLKMIKVKGSVTRMERLASAKFIDAYASEIDKCTRGAAQTLDGICLWGSATADAYQWTGVEPTASTNLTDAAAATQTLAMLDEMIDATSKGGSEDNNRIFLMSNEQISKCISLQRAMQLLGPMITLSVKKGWIVAGYRDIPLIPNSCCRPKSAWSGSVTLAATGTGGTLPANAVNAFRMSYVDVFGEQWASASATVATSGTTSRITLTWTAQTLDTDSETKALYYKIYFGNTDGARANLTLYKRLAAKNYDANGLFSSNVTSYSFTGADTQISSVQHPYISGALDETIFLVNYDPERSLEFPYLSEENRPPITVVELARVSTAYDFQLEAIGAMAFRDEAILAVKRGVKAS